MNSRSTLTAFGLLGAAILFAAALDRSDPLLPPGFSLLEEITGPDAAAMVDRLHGRTVTPEESAVFRYASPAGQVIVYRSSYTSDGQAASIAERMRQRIKTGGFGFSNLAEITQSGVVVARCAGLGRIHFLFAASHEVYWVEAEPAAVSSAWEFVTYTLRRAS